MNPRTVMELTAAGEPASAQPVTNQGTGQKQTHDPERTRKRRFFRRAWTGRKPRRAATSTAASVDRARLLSAAEECALAEQIKAGDQAAEQKLVTANLGLVLHAVNSYKTHGISPDDLIQEGNLGLIRAARHFDPQTHTARFATYATYWIRCYMVRALSSNSPLIQRPENLRLQRMRCREALSELRTHVAAASGEAASHLPTLEEIAKYLGVAPERLEQESLASGDYASYQSLGGDDLLPDDGPAPDDDLVINEERAIVCAALRRLSPFEAWVICERFGLGDTSTRRTRPANREKPADPDTPRDAVLALDPDSASEGRWRTSNAYFQRSYIDMGRDCGLSVFRLRQVERTAIAKLRKVLAQRSPDAT